MAKRYVSDFHDPRFGYGPVTADELAAELARVERLYQRSTNVLAWIVLAFYAWLFRNQLAAVLRDVVTLLERGPAADV